uniref:Uncharacterized protein n=1 Tax=Octopus bimaculoides TaxID=37653 RepID=A0A0L8GV54_OCTBM
MCFSIYTDTEMDGLMYLCIYVCVYICVCVCVCVCVFTISLLFFSTFLDVVLRAFFNQLSCVLFSAFLTTNEYAVGTKRQKRLFQPACPSVQSLASFCHRFQYYRKYLNITLNPCT